FAGLRSLLLDVHDLETHVRLVEHRGFHAWPPRLPENVRQPYSGRGPAVNATVCAHFLEGARFAASPEREGCMEVFQRGEVVALREATVDRRGRVIGVSADGRTVDVHWSLRPGHQDKVTTEDEASLRLVHESEEGMAAA